MKTLIVVAALFVSANASAVVHEAYAVGNSQAIVYQFEKDRATLADCKRDIDIMANEYVAYGATTNAFHGMCFELETGRNLYTATVQRP